MKTCDKCKGTGLAESSDILINGRWETVPEMCEVCEGEGEIDDSIDCPDCPNTCEKLGYCPHK